MAVNIDINSKMRSTVNEVVPLILLSSMMLVFFDMDDWSLVNVIKEMLRALAISVAATALALLSLWVGLKTAHSNQSVAKGWFAGSAVFLAAVAMAWAVTTGLGVFVP
jgi:hypothetical protein